MSDSTQNPPPEPGEGGYTPPPPPPGEPGVQYPPAPGPGYGTPPSGVGQPANLLMRFLARLIDFILVGIVNAIVVSAVIVGAIMGSSVNTLGTGGGFAAGATYSIVATAITLAYFALLESRKGQTVGKMLLKLQTQGPDGRTPTLEEAVKRNAFVAIGLLGIIPFLGLVAGLISLAAYIMIAVTINSSPTNQGWHDNFAGGTKVIKIG